MIIEEKIRNEKLKYDTNREAAKFSVFLSDRIYKHGYLVNKEILSYDQSKIIKQTIFPYSSLGKTNETNKNN